VERAATQIAQKVWSTSAKTRSQLFDGLNPNSAEEFLAHAIAMQWLRIDGDRIAPGLVDPRLAVTTRIPNF
jgi:hypothetical protein